MYFSWLHQCIKSEIIHLNLPLYIEALNPQIIWSALIKFYFPNLHVKSNKSASDHFHVLVFSLYGSNSNTKNKSNCTLSGLHDQDAKQSFYCSLPMTWIHYIPLIWGSSPFPNNHGPKLLAVWALFNKQRKPKSITSFTLQPNRIIMGLKFMKIVLFLSPNIRYLQAFPSHTAESLTSTSTFMTSFVA